MASEESEAMVAEVEIGQTVYDEDGTELGNVRGLDEVGFYVKAREGSEKLTVEQARDVFGKAYVMWRCWECGAMEQIEGQLPDECPDCGAPREELYYWAED